MSVGFSVLICQVRICVSVWKGGRRKGREGEGEGKRERGGRRAGEMGYRKREKENKEWRSDYLQKCTSHHIYLFTVAPTLH